MRLFENYKTSIEKVLNKSANSLEKGISSPYALLNLSERSYTSTLPTVQERSQTILKFDSSKLRRYFGPNKYSFENIKIGNHPDFQHLSDSQTLMHHCVSMFVDIKGSTRLALKYPLEDVRLIKDTLLTLCINIVTYFGGHVHRLQGDAVFVQFVRSNSNPNDSIINSLNAASVLCQVVSQDLATAFENHGLDPIKIRVGIDYGSDEQVMWSHYGIANCNELTTTSLHTDLAAKLQNSASVNSIRIGKNVVDAIEMKYDFYSAPTIVNGGVSVEDRYIIQSSDFRYRQYDFHWKKYLSSFSFYRNNGNEKLELTESNYTIRSFILRPNSEEKDYQYFENNHAIHKGKFIKYELHHNGLPYHRKPFETITWEAYNSGNEAKIAKEEHHDFERNFVNKTYCLAHTGYHGNHYLKCTIRREHSPNEVLKFPIYVDDKDIEGAIQYISK